MLLLDLLPVLHTHQTEGVIAVADYEENNKLRLIDVATTQVTTLADFGYHVNKIDYSPDGKYIAVSNQALDSIELINVATAVKTTLAGGSREL